MYTLFLRSKKGEEQDDKELFESIKLMNISDPKMEENYLWKITHRNIPGGSYEASLSRNREIIRSQPFQNSSFNYHRSFSPFNALIVFFIRSRHGTAPKSPCSDIKSSPSNLSCKKVKSPRSSRRTRLICFLPIILIVCHFNKLVSAQFKHDKKIISVRDTQNNYSGPSILDAEVAEVYKTSFVFQITQMSLRFRPSDNHRRDIVSLVSSIFS